ncbi:MAG: hypothetical protein BWY70_01812 [Bacteroidetes bacterium ADurb.Bin408]|jgi:hypothetical protein|nr:hypothetical protein [Bacteroidales bacterium]OPZ96244.1 MAG: hypothetical protein BWY70_01812 [Bacteroidetes bacterium ADurb.Bin408]HPI31108.1 hypothetical protein [Bacteroidales bacterium]
MYPGLKIKFTNSELGSFYMIISSATKRYNYDALSNYAMRDIMHDMMLNIAHRMVKKADTYSITFRPAQVYFMRDLLDSFEFGCGYFERLVLEKIYAKIDKFIIDLPQTAALHHGIPQP